MLDCNSFVFCQKQFATLSREKQTLEKRLQHSNSKLAQIQTELTEEKDLRKALQSNQVLWQAKYKKLQDELSELKTAKETEITDLKEQIRDLMFFLDAQKQIEQSVDREEIAAGQIVIPSSPKSGKSSGSRGHRSKRR